MILKEEILFSSQECLSIIWNGKDKTEWEMPDRKYDSVLINYNDDTKWIFDKLKNFFEDETGIKIIDIKKKIHFHKFIKGDWFDRHNDAREGRLYAVGVLLNEDFIGGDFKLYGQEELVLSKKTGNTYVFDTRIDHEISPILSGERYSLLWFLQKEHIKFEINKLL